jgi:serine/threonine protein kinase
MTVVPGELDSMDDGCGRPGGEFGPNRLISQIGEGGFGAVSIAEHQHPFTQWVDLRIVNPGMDARAGIARVERELQALAMMDHPHVARDFDGWMPSTGRPYFAMELV